MKLKLIAPFKTNFNILYFNALKNHKEYTQFWTQVQDDLFDESFIEVHHILTNDLIYEDIETDGNNFSPKVLTFNGDPVWEDIFKEANEIFQDSLDAYQIKFDEMLEATLCHVYDNAIGIIETDIYINDWQIEKNKGNLSEFLREIQLIGNKFMNFFTKSYYDKVLKKRIEDLKQLDSNKLIQKKHVNQQVINKLDKKNKTIYFPKEKLGIPLWVNRTLYVNELKNPNLIYNQWLSLGEDDIEIVTKRIKNDRFYFGWGNNIVIGIHDENILNSAIDAVNLAQYYNVIFDYTNNHLSKLIGEVYTTNNKKENIKQIENILEINIENANLLFMQFNEHSLNLQGHRKKYFDDLIKKWNIEKIKENILNKITFSKDKLNDFYRKSTKVSRMISESILFGIGGVALVDFFANISHFARTIKVNPSMSSYDEHSFGFISLGKILSPDSMIWTGVLILLFLIIVFINVRRKG